MIAVNALEQRVELVSTNQRKSWPLVKLPVKFVEWQIQSRRELFDKLLRREQVRFLASHLPVLATLNANGVINLANKGVGLVPKEEHLTHYIGLFRYMLSEGRSRPWDETLEVRVEVASELLEHPEHIDPYRLGSLEIFEGQTFQNIQENPQVALLFTGAGPEHLSFQLDSIAQILKPGQQVYEFLQLSRLLFEYERFHIAQPAYPWAYQLWVHGVQEKTPHRRT